MADRERVIEGLRKAAEELARYAPMKVNGRCQMYFDEAIYLLKEQEAVKPILVKLYPHDVYKCGNCGHCAVGTTVPKTYRPKYCPECGRKVKWDESVD